MLMSECRRQLLSYQIKLLLSSSSPGHYMYLGSDLNMCRVTGNVNLSPCDERYSGKFCPVRNFGPGNDNQSWHRPGTSSLRAGALGQCKILGTISTGSILLIQLHHLRVGQERGQCDKYVWTGWHRGHWSSALWTISGHCSWHLSNIWKTECRPL